MSGLFSSVAGVTALSGIGAFALCLRSVLELREGSPPISITSGGFLVSVLAGAVAGCLAGAAITSWVCGSAGSAQCAYPLLVSLPIGIATGEILGLAALVGWKRLHPGTAIQADVY